MDLPSLVRSIMTAQPDEVYNLAAISHVGYSFKNAELTADVTGEGVLRMLEAIRLSGGRKQFDFIRLRLQKCLAGWIIIVRERL